MRVFTVLAFATLSFHPVATQERPVFDHSPFDQLLMVNVSPEGLVDYDGFGASSTFQQYLRALAEAPVDEYPESERLALWINAYNAYTIELINRHEERESIRNINKTLGLIGRKGPWKERLAEVAGEVWTLDEIEQEIIRKRFAEPRIHFALVCAALGCPPLRAEAYSGEKLDSQLDDQARAFLLQSPKKNWVDPEEGIVHLSPIFDWYREDFPDGSAGFGAYLAQYYQVPAEKELLLGGQFRVKHTDYDWSLNLRPKSVPPRPAARPLSSS